MTPTIDLDDQAWFDAIPVDGIGVHVLKHWCPLDTDGDGDCATCARQPGIHGLDPRWVALSEQKCETCGGDGLVMLPKPDDKLLADCGPCPDCLGSGRPLVQVTVPCATCTFSRSPIGLELCAECGRVSIGSVTVEAVVPVIRSPHDQPDGYYIETLQAGTAYYVDVRRRRTFNVIQAVDLGSNPEQYVGKFGVIVKRPA